jgi:hypothetical protein
MSEHQDIPAATSLGELDLHLRYMRIEVQKLVAAMPQMATKQDIAELSRKFDGYATHDDVRALRVDLEVVRAQVESGSVQSTVDRWGNLAQKVAAIIAFATGAVYFLHSLLEKVR